MKDVQWYMGWGKMRPELGRFSMAFMSLVHVPHQNRWPYFRGWEYWTVLRHLDLCETDRVLDAGSMRSYTPVWLAQRAGQVVCVDSGVWEEVSRTPGQLTFEEWSQELQLHGGRPIEVHKMDICNLELPIHSYEFDLITCWSVFEHIEDDARASRELHRVTKVGGVLSGTVDWGCPQESRPNSRLYSNETFNERVVEPAGWEYIVSPPPVQPVEGRRSAMVFFLRKRGGK